MPNPAPDTTHLKPFTPTTAREAAAKSAAKRASKEPLVAVNVKVYERQKRECIRRGLNLSQLIRALLDEHLAEKRP